MLRQLIELTAILIKSRKMQILVKERKYMTPSSTFSRAFACVVSLLSTTLVPQNASASEHSRRVNISGIATVSTVRLQYAGSTSLTRIYVSPVGAWGGSTCRADAADISMDDWHTYGLVMRAWKDNIPITVTIESNLRLDTTDVVCKIIAISTN